MAPSLEDAARQHVFSQLQALDYIGARVKQRRVSKKTKVRVREVGHGVAEV
jgi:hypothetical protein